jgi:phage shock protein PspC (stress-responsive transcriptional regulator)
MRRLYRSRNDRIIAGVAGGLADYFGVDPTIIRLVWALLLLPGGIPGVLLYALCWIIIPPATESYNPAQLGPVERPHEPVATATGAPTLPDVVPPPARRPDDEGRADPSL